MISVNEADVIEVLNKSPLKFLGLTFTQIAEELISSHYKGDKGQEAAFRVTVAKTIQSLIESKTLVMQRDWRVTFNANVTANTSSILPVEKETS